MIKTKSRFALLLPGLYEGGAERVMLNLSAGLAARGYSIDLVLAQAEGPYMDQIPATVRVVELNRRHLNTLRTMRSLPALVRYLRQERPDALLSVLNTNYVALWARRFTGIPQHLVICEQNNFSQANKEAPLWYSALIHWLTRRFYPWADAIVAVSEGVADDLAKTAGIGRDRVQVVYNPVITPELDLKKKESLEHPWFMPGEPPVVLAVGRLTAQKDFGTLINAFASVRRSRPARLIILGEGEERPGLELLVRQAGLEKDIQLPGFVANPYQFMARAALLVLSSRWEGLPTVLVEGLYCGAFIVATDCPSGPSEILRNPEYGRLVSVGDVSSLAAAMDSALAHRSPPPNRDSWQPFELDTVIEQYLSILRAAPRKVQQGALPASLMTKETQADPKPTLLTAGEQGSTAAAASLLPRTEDAST